MEVSALPRPSGGIQPRSRRLLSAFGDERLVEQLRRGNDAAFEVIYDRHHRGILSFCRHMLRSQEEAEDAVQQTFISAYGDLRGSHKEIRLKPWLYTIARNRCLSILRARREQPVEIDDVPTAGFAEDVARREDLRLLLADMRELPEDQRAALVLSELGDLSHTEIAGIVGCETLKVKSLVFQARSSLVESRDAREIPCEEIREQLATLTGGALRRAPLRRHLKACPNCAEFREDVKRQRQMVACLLPVIPTIGLKHGVLAAVGLGGPGGAAGAGAAGAGGIVSGIGGSSAAKLGLVAVVATGAIGGGLVVRHSVDKAGGDTGQPAVPGAVNADKGLARPETLTPAASGHAARHGSLVQPGHRAGSQKHHAAAARPAPGTHHGHHRPGTGGNAIPRSGSSATATTPRTHRGTGNHYAYGHAHAPGWREHHQAAPPSPKPPPAHGDSSDGQAHGDAGRVSGQQDGQGARSKAHLLLPQQ
jgi:RNA polymerase sigma factor (sigma-70 family)